jgi:hypothetical protein
MRNGNCSGDNEGGWTWSQNEVGNRSGCGRLVFGEGFQGTVRYQI